MNYGRYGTTSQISDDFKAIIYVRQNKPDSNSIFRQMEICQNFADFHDYEIVGLATTIDTLMNTDIEYDAVIVSSPDRISRNIYEYERIKQQLLKRKVIIISAVRTF